MYPTSMVLISAYLDQDKDFKIQNVLQAAKSNPPLLVAKHFKDK